MLYKDLYNIIGNVIDDIYVVKNIYAYLYHLYNIMIL